MCSAPYEIALRAKLAIFLSMNANVKAVVRAGRVIYMMMQSRRYVRVVGDRRKGSEAKRLARMRAEDSPCNQHRDPAEFGRRKLRSCRSNAS